VVEDAVWWRVGHADDPAGFVPQELSSFNHRFDDATRRFRTIYAAKQAETALREVLADLRPNSAAIARFVAKFGPASANDIPSHPVSERWRQLNVLARVQAELSGPVVDLRDADVRNELEREHAALLQEHGMDHLDLPQITADNRVVTQTIASSVYDNRDAAAIAFFSKLDGQACVVIFEGRGALQQLDGSIPLTDPAPEPLRRVCEEWHLDLEPAAPV
jgi:hypothetical protein